MAHIGSNEWVFVRNLKKRDYDEVVRLNRFHDDERMKREDEKMQTAYTLTLQFRGKINQSKITDRFRPDFVFVLLPYSWHAKAFKDMDVEAATAMAQGKVKDKGKGEKEKDETEVTGEVKEPIPERRIPNRFNKKPKQAGILTSFRLLKISDQIAL
jgi:hypothetical protein